MVIFMKLYPGRDGRQRVSSPLEWPYSVHGRFVATCDDGLFLASGSLIGPRFVLTAAHNVYHRRRMEEVDISHIRFIPAMHGFSCPYRSLNILQIFYPEEFKIDGKEDYAILVLDRDISSDTSYLKLKAFTRDELDRRTAGLYGYPININNQDTNLHYMWGMEGPVQVDIMCDMNRYHIDTSSGQTGAAIVFEDRGEYYAVGVHVHGDEHYNTAICMNRDRVERIISWMNSVNSLEEGLG
jgi:V8-like Glu-specific endopeptidase